MMAQVLIAGIYGNEKCARFGGVTSAADAVELET